MAFFRRRSYPPWPLEYIMETDSKYIRYLLGMVLAWGYEGSEYRKYPMAVLMHGPPIWQPWQRLAKYS